MAADGRRTRPRAAVHCWAAHRASRLRRRSCRRPPAVRNAVTPADADESARSQAPGVIPSWCSMAMLLSGYSRSRKIRRPSAPARRHPCRCGHGDPRRRAQTRRSRAGPPPGRRLWHGIGETAKVPPAALPPDSGRRIYPPGKVPGLTWDDSREHRTRAEGLPLVGGVRLYGAVNTRPAGALALEATRALLAPLRRGRPGSARRGLVLHRALGSTQSAHLLGDCLAEPLAVLLAGPAALVGEQQCDFR